MDQNKDIENKNVKKKKGRFILSYKIAIYLLPIVVGAILIALILGNVQRNASLKKQRDNNNLALSEVTTLLDKNTVNSDDLTKIFHEGNWQTLDNIDHLLAGGLYEKMQNNDNEIKSQIFDELSDPDGVAYLYLLSKEGKVVISPDPSLYDINPAASSHMTQENLNRILKYCRQDDGTLAPEKVKNQHGTYYFYSKPFIYNDQEYVLAIGTSSWALDERIASLKDVSAVLSRMGAINDGFLFAISRTDDLFLYYKNGADFLTGQNAFTTGLNQEVMEDGYNGTQTILDEKYYCTSKAFGEDTVIVAAAKAETVVSKDKYVLLWSIMGFVLIMSLCLVYSIIVRNDYIRQGVKTERIPINKNSEKTLYFNKSVFSRVFPLILIGILTVYGISFYTQTLLEIEEGVDKSNVILQEVTGRYEENIDSQKVIEDYYNSRFLSTAKLVKFFVEENPQALNASSEYYHVAYDENGNKHYINDDEGNRLKSVAYSAELKKLCEDNEINSIYIYDENGHTIATSTGNWFFTLSQDESAQSYPFRQILDGRTDSYLQTSMTDDLGENAQYFGIVMHYYTTVDASGNTRYVSRYEFEQACEAEGVSGVTNAGGITKHRSLLQIGLDQQLASSITETTNAEYILSTEMLSGGAIIMFDTTSDHTCVYSPVRSSIGRTAKDLGISDKAFSGETYYGFNRINGVQYFQFFRYMVNQYTNTASDYYIATALPASNMFTTRGTISAITAAVCLVLITVLLAIITVQHKEEEVYDLWDDIKVDEDLNSLIFNIVLPSGRSASTTRAMTRWNNQRIPWNQRSPEMKLGAIIGWMIAIPILYFVLSAIGINNVSGGDSVISYIFTGNWDKSPNVFALSAAIMVITVTVIAIQLLKIPVRLITNLLGTQGETLGHLFLSIVRYGGAITAVFYCLYLFGVDSPNLLASAGILSLVIGLGAQSLIKDIIAGIFIVFEGEFRVGDIVTINGFRGTVTDIGLRTTKITGSGNVKIFNNSEISGVLNMTKETSVAAATIGLEYGQDINYVEKVLEHELPLLKDKNKWILDGPTNLGVSELAERRFTVTVIARCTEKYVNDLSRYLNKSLLQIFNEYGIKIANQPADTVKKIETKPAEENKQEEK
ncbi:MAG: mechanosensitive ion channel family protein [Erysipelotrichaceae bacterium]|nr:mechanosensitive ion channel family protein [Erysipelotrichaceae bacterium]